MAEPIKFFRPRLAAAGLFAGLALSGCSATHVADSWQCPLAQGNVCTSVAAADSAVPKTDDEAALAAATPLYRVQPASPALPRCTDDCNPFAWLASLFTADKDDARAVGGQAEQDIGASASAGISATDSDGSSVPVPANAGGVAEGAGVATAEETQANAASEAAGADAAPEHVAEARSVPSSTPVPADADLRTDEVIGRIWIAPFVDADGLYHEAGWVRVVLEPAGWRLR